MKLSKALSYLGTRIAAIASKSACLFHRSSPLPFQQPDPAHPQPFTQGTRTPIFSKEPGWHVLHITSKDFRVDYSYPRSSKPAQLNLVAKSEMQPEPLEPVAKSQMPPVPLKLVAKSQTRSVNLFRLSAQEMAEAKAEGIRLATLGVAMDARARAGKPKIPMERIAWTPEASQMTLGTVILERPTKPLTMDQYRWALTKRIDRMIAEAGPEEAFRLLWEAEDQEGLHLSNHLGQAGEVLAWESEHLLSQTGMLLEEWPIPPAKIKQTIDPPMEMIEEETLEDFLGKLYREIA